MKHPRLVAIAVCIVLTCPSLLPAADAHPKTPTDSYLEYHAALAKATKLAEVLPYLSSVYRSNLESRPREDQPVWLKRLQESAMSNVKITKETINGDKCTLEATGTSPHGNAMKGKISLVKQGGAWKLDAEGWSMQGIG